MPDNVLVLHGVDGRSRLLIFKRDDGLFTFGADVILAKDDDVDEAARGCWRSDVSGFPPSGLYGSEEEAFAAGRTYLGWDR